MLELRNICKSYRGQQALTDIDLEIREREMVSIMEIMTLFMRLHRELDTTFLIITHDREIAAYTSKSYNLIDGGLTQ